MLLNIRSKFKEYSHHQLLSLMEKVSLGISYNKEFKQSQNNIINLINISAFHCHNVPYTCHSFLSFTLKF